MIVSDSSPIISLGKQGALDLLRKCFVKVFIPKEVLGEVMEKEESAEARSLEKAIDDGWIIVREIKIDKAIDTKNLGKGEKEAISLAAELGHTLLIDDDNAKRYASILGVEGHGILFVIYLSVLKKFIDKSKAKKMLEDMIRDGFYVSTDLYSEFLNLLDRI